MYSGSVYHLLNEQQTEQYSAAIARVLKRAGIVCSLRGVCVVFVVVIVCAACLLGGGVFFGRTGGSSHETDPIRADRFACLFSSLFCACLLSPLTSHTRTRSETAGQPGSMDSKRGDLRFLHSRKTLTEQLNKYGFVDVSVT